ncbi:HAMP domain-containing histidine kinase [Brevibacillus ruminantium]|uniref:histidine kinase n=1 Tax=Brevibacillus ruminantium TaxID=2950604 RepID=A0ABY4WL76_9BACL|nr:ATP-binding protein [Brevibacillus ruminantium]USG66893.1 HAMP domain-containing histidine kinase [Brevibacillus ruminantium]
MFKKTRIRLVILNVIVFVILLNGLGSALYFSMQYRLISQVDKELIRAGKRLAQAPPPFLKADRKRFPDVDRRIIFLLWDDKGGLIGNFYGETLEREELLPFHPDRRAAEIENVSENGQTYRVYTMFVDKQILDQGKIKTVSYIQLIYNLEPEMNMLGTLLYVLGIGGLVSIGIALFAGLFLAKRALIPIQQSWEKQQQFIADASHELRTPLSVILVNLERLFRSPGRTIEEESEHILVSIQETRRLNKLVSDLLTLARTDSNELQLLKQTVPMGELVEKSVQTFRQLATVRGISIETDIQQPLEMSGDQERLQQLLVIMLDNALKYSYEQGVIAVSCKRDGHGISLIVKDSGIGISQEDIPYVFDRFYRADKMRSRKLEGTGLGLSIAKWIVDAHGGKIRVESEEGKGTSFIVWLPVKSG